MPVPLPSWQAVDYWHVARAQIHLRTSGVHDYFCNDNANNLRNVHSDVTFHSATESCHVVRGSDKQLQSVEFPSSATRRLRPAG